MNEKIIQASSMLRRGKIVAFPTETVYALAADAANIQAISEIYKLKGRAKNNPLAVFVGDIKNVENFAYVDERARKIAEKFCPGPITLVLPKSADSILPGEMNPGYDSVAVRIPDNAVALGILREFGKPVIATSANISGQAAAVNVAQVREYFGDRIDLVIGGGRAESGIASTIVDLTGGEIKLLRQGNIELAEILAVL